MTNPYKYVKRKDNGKNDVAHRVIMETHLGRKLSTDETVHHIDHNPKNNDITNLELTTKHIHGQHHAKPKTIILVKCGWCGKLTQKLKREHDYKVKHGTTTFFCNKSCSGHVRTPPRNKPKKAYGENNLPLCEFVKQECDKGKTATDIIKEYGVNKANVYYAIKKNRTPVG